MIRRTLLAGLVAAAAAGCGGDQTGPSPNTLTATWNATSAQFVSVANPAQMAELVGMGGSVKLTLNANNTFTMTTMSPGNPMEQLTGTWSSSVDVLTLTHGTGTSQFDMTLNGNTLTLKGAHGSFDVNGDDVDEAVTMNFTMTRS
jgi:hypothetical protein